MGNCAGCVGDSQPLSQKPPIHIIRTINAAPVKFNTSKCSKQYPDNCIGLLVCEIKRPGQSKSTSIGTGFLIGPNLVLTVAHNIFDTTLKGRKYDRIIFYPGADGKLANIIDPPIITPKIHTKPDQVEMELKQRKGVQFCQIPSSQQYAVILLDQEIIRDQYIRLGYNYQQLDSRDAEVCGYPLDKNKKYFRQQKFLQCQQHKQTGKIKYCFGSKIIQSNEHNEIAEMKQDQKELFIHLIKTSAGNSGSPVMIQFVKGAYYAVGLHCKIKPDKKNQSIKYACRLSTQKVLQIRQWALQLIEANKQTFLPEDYSRYKRYVQYTLCTDFRKIKSEKGINPENVMNGQYVGQVGIDNIRLKLQQKQNKIEEQRKLDDQNSFHNIVQCHIEAAAFQYRLQQYAKAQNRLIDCLNQINNKDEETKQTLRFQVAQINSILGSIALIKKQNNIAMEYFEQSMQTYAELSQIQKLVQIYQKMALCRLASSSDNPNNITLGLKIYMWAERVARQKGLSKRLQANLLMQIGNTIMLSQDIKPKQSKQQQQMPKENIETAEQKYQSALKIYEQVLEECIKDDKKQLKDENGKVLQTILGKSVLKVYYQIGVCHYNLGKYYFAVQQCLQAFKQFKLAFQNFFNAKFEPGDGFQQLVSGFTKSFSRYIKAKITSKLAKDEEVSLKDRQTIMDVMKQVQAMFEEYPISLRSLQKLSEQIKSGKYQANTIQLQRY